MNLLYRLRDAFCLLDEGNRPATPVTKLYNHSPKTAPAKLSNETKNELNQKLETAGGV